jgi:lactoylglutathione lyase
MLIGLRRRLPAVVGAALLAAIWAHALLAFGDAGTDDFFARWMHDAVFVVAGLACVADAIATPRRRLPATALGAGLLLVTVGDLIYSMAPNLDAVPVPSLSDPFWLALFETHLTVRDLSRSIAFYRDVVGLPLALDVPQRGAAFFWIGGPGQAMLGLWSLGSAPVGLSLHIALKASLEDVLGACDALRSIDVTPLSFFGTEATEPSVIGWMPAAAVYFRDPDGHLIEYLAMLDESPRPERGMVAWSQWASSDPNAGRVRVQRHTGPRDDLRPLFEEVEDSAQQLDTYLDAGEVFVAIADDQVGGHLQLVETAAADASEIKNMAVKAQHRGRGIGRMLIPAAIDLTRARG